jgi:CRP/FNR family transcriptional regulator, anaerobic regulatory protein
MAEAKTKSGSSTPCKDCPLRRLSEFRAFTPEELVFVDQLKSGELIAEAGTSILLEGQSSAHLYTVLSGWAFRYKTLPDGRRQILNFALPGDFLGLQTTVFKEMDHSVEALTPIVLCVFPRQKIWSLYKDHPGLAFDLTWIASREERMLDEQLLSVGRRSALERLSQVLVNVNDRARSLKLASPRQELHLPFTQQHLADALGLSLVHTNKTIRRLTDRGLIHWKDGRFKILDEAALRQIAGYESREPPKRPFI